MVCVLLIVGTILTAVVPHGSAHAVPHDHAAASAPAGSHQHAGHAADEGVECEDGGCKADFAPAGCITVSSHCVTLLPSVEVTMLVPLPLTLRRAVGDGAMFVARSPETETPPPRL